MKKQSVKKKGDFVKSFLFFYEKVVIKFEIVDFFDIMIVRIRVGYEIKV